VGSFLITIAPQDSFASAADTFQRGLARAAQPVQQTIAATGMHIAAFARWKGAGAALATEDASGRWLLAVGSWFHKEGASLGEEAALLSRIGRIGPERVARELEGFFAIMYGDPVTREIVVVTDPMGSRHCFVRDLGDCVAISTSSLLLARLAPAALDPIGTEEYLRLGVIYEDRTLFRDVKKIPPATIAQFSGGRPAGSSRYWRIADLEPAPNEAKSVNEFCTALERAARRIVQKYPHPVCDLTAGYDSRVMAAAMLRTGAAFETTVSGPAQSPDVTISQRLAVITGRPHWHIEPIAIDEESRWQAIERSVLLTDGEYDPVEYSRILRIHETLSARDFDASINGSYGEIARGYWWEALGLRVGAREPLDARALARQRYAAGAGSALFGRPIDLVEHLAAIIADANRDLSNRSNTLQMDHVYLQLRMQRWQGRIASSTDQVWPCLSFFLFRSVLESALRIDWRLRRGNGLIHRVLPMLSPALAAVPLDAGYPPVTLTLRTLPCYVAGIPHFAANLAGKVRRRVLKNDLAGADRVKQSRRQFRAGARVREILTPDTMKLRGFLDENLLRRFLEDSLRADFRFDAEWNRLLGVEMALR
jgi:asparagine synthase (glutamine-hydrolysing)